MGREFDQDKGAGPIVCLTQTGFSCRNAAMTATPTLAADNMADLVDRLGARSVVFVGLMGAGKTAIGRKVATMLGLPFTDSDHEIESVSRMTIPDLFERYGEAEFRALEQRVIVRVLENGPQVLSTGGGAFMNAQTRDAIAACGLSVWLKADVDTLLDRVSKKQNRPLLKNADPRGVLEKLMLERNPVYALADVTVATRDERKEVIADEVIEAIGRHLTSHASVPTTFGETAR
jgi:shikimate kinase